MTDAVIMDECEFTGITQAFCAHCKDKTRPAKPRPSFSDMASAPSVLRPPVTEAQFDSHCPECGCEIDEGDMIAKRDDQWVCAPCGYTHDIQQARAKHPSGGNHAAT